MPKRLRAAASVAAAIPAVAAIPAAAVIPAVFEFPSVSDPGARTILRQVNFDGVQPSLREALLRGVEVLTSVALSFVAGSVVTGIDLETARSVHVAAAAVRIHRALLTGNPSPQRTKNTLSDVVVANFLSNTVKKLLNNPVPAASLDSAITSLAAVYALLAPAFPATVLAAAPAPAAVLAIGAVPTGAPAIGAAAGVAAFSARSSLHWPITASPVQPRAPAGAGGTEAAIASLELQLVALRGQLPGGASSSAALPWSPAAAAAPPPPAIVAALELKQSLVVPVQRHLVEALNIDNASTSGFRPLAQERTLAQAFLTAFAIPGSFQPSLSDIPVADRMSPRQICRDVIIENLTAARFDPLAVDLLGPFLVALAFVLEDGPRPPAVSPCSWRAFLANSTVGSAPVSAQQALSTFATVGLLHADTLPQSWPPGPTQDISGAGCDSDDEEAAASSEAAFGTPQFQAPQPAPARRIPSFPGEFGLEGSFKPFTQYLSRVAADPSLRSGDSLISGNSLPGARIFAATAMLSVKSIAEASTIHLDAIPFGTPGAGYAATITSHAGMKPLQQHIDTFRQFTFGLDAVTGANLTLVANAFCSVAGTADPQMGLGFDAAALAYFADAQRDGRLPHSLYAFYATWGPVASETEIVVFRMLTGRPHVPGLRHPPSLSVAPCIALSELYGAAIYNTLSEATARWSSTPVEWLCGFLFCELVLRGILHLRLHVSLVTALDRIVPVGLGSSSPYICYGIRDTATPSGFPFVRGQSTRVLQQSWLPAPELMVRPAGPPALQLMDRTTAASGSPTPWFLANPDTPRPKRLCLICGPIFTHQLGDSSCPLMTAYVASPGARAVPNFKQFPVGATYNDFLRLTKK